MDRMNLLKRLRALNIHPSKVLQEIPQGFFEDVEDVHAMLVFFNTRTILELRDDWKERPNAKEIELLSMRNTIRQGFGLREMRDAEGFSEQSMQFIEAFCEVLEKIKVVHGEDDFDFWVKIARKYKRCVLKDLLFEKIYSWQFYDEQLAKLVTKIHLLKYVPKDKITPDFLKQLRRYFSASDINRYLANMP